MKHFPFVSGRLVHPRSFLDSRCPPGSHSMGHPPPPFYLPLHLSWAQPLSHSENMPLSPVLRSIGLPAVNLLSLICLLGIQTSQNGRSHLYSLPQQPICLLSTWQPGWCQHCSAAVMPPEVTRAMPVTFHLQSRWYFMLDLTKSIILLILNTLLPWLPWHHRLLDPLPFWQILPCSFGGPFAVPWGSQLYSLFRLYLSVSQFRFSP